MRVSAIKRWHWIVIALVVGSTVGWIRQATTDFEDELDSHGTLMSSQRKFEEGLVSESEGIRQFKDITVYPYTVRQHNGGKRLVYIVTGRYWNGEPVLVNGQLQAHFAPTCFLAPVPFHPKTIPDLGANKTILDFLDHLHKTAGVQYRYAWWWWMVTPLSLWLVSSLVLIGGVWPSLVNLIAFGTLWRPKEEKGISLLHVHAPPPTKTVPASAAFGHLTELEKELEEKLAGGAVVAPEPLADAAAPKKLASGPMEPAAVAAPQEQHEYGADKDDFYPTEVHTRPHRPAN